MENTKDLTFSDALIHLKNGNRLARSGWNGKNMWVYHVRETTDVEFEIDYDGFELDATIQPYFVIVSGTIANTWVPSVSDILAVDWYII